MRAAPKVQRAVVQGSVVVVLLVVVVLDVVVVEAIWNTNAPPPSVPA